MTRICISCCTCCEESDNKLAFHKNFDFFHSHILQDKKVCHRVWNTLVCEISVTHTSAAEDSSLLCSHQLSDGTTVLQNVASYLLNDTPHIPQNPKLQVRSLCLVEARSSIYVAAVLIMKHQFMYSPSQIKVHLVSCTQTVVFNWANYNKCAATWHVVPFLLCTQHLTDLQKIIYKLIINNGSLYCLSNNEMLKKVMFSD